jgi:hypothetical protein
MKKIMLILAGLVILATAYTLVNAKERTSDALQSTSAYIIIRYSPSGLGRGNVLVNYGGTKVENLEVPKDNLKSGGGGPTNYVIDLLSQFNEKGYSLVSTVSHPAGDNWEITCFLRQSL